VSAVPAVVEQPRPFGYVVGDLIQQRVLLQAGTHPVDPTSLPRPGRVGVWLDRRVPSISRDAQGRRWLVVDYQLINAPQGLTTVNLPAWELGTKSGQTLSVARWPISVGPLTGRTVIAQGGLQALRADRPAPIVPTEPIARQIEIWTGALALTLLVWIGWFVWRNWRDALEQPFARAAREMRGVGDEAPQAWQALHRAFDRTAGRVVQTATLASLFERASHLEPLRPRIEEFFRCSADYFFGSGPASFSVHALCNELRRVERRYHP
jgi:mxaA protein